MTRPATNLRISSIAGERGTPWPGSTGLLPEQRRARRGKASRRSAGRGRGAVGVRRCRRPSRPRRPTRSLLSPTFSPRRGPEPAESSMAGTYARRDRDARHRRRTRRLHRRHPTRPARPEGAARRAPRARRGVPEPRVHPLEGADPRGRHFTMRSEPRVPRSACSSENPRFDLPSAMAWKESVVREGARRGSSNS